MFGGVKTIKLLYGKFTDMVSSIEACGNAGKDHGIERIL
jgi:hypothetical protein